MSNWRSHEWTDSGFPYVTLPSTDLSSLLVQTLPDVNSVHSHPRDVKENKTNQTKRPSFTTPKVQFWRSYLTVDSGHHGHSDWSVATQPHVQQSAIHCVLWHIPPVTIITIFSDVCHSRPSVKSDQMGQPSLPSCIGEPVCPFSDHRQ